MSKSGLLLLVVTICVLLLYALFRLISMYLKNRSLNALAEQIFFAKVENPFGPEQSHQKGRGKAIDAGVDTIAIGDLLISSAWNIPAINSMLDSYGINNIRDAVDPHSNDTFSTLARVAGRNFEFTKATGEVLAGKKSELPLVDHSNLFRLRDYANSRSCGDSSLAGHVTELKLEKSLTGLGFKAHIAESPTQKGYDLTVNKDFFDAHHIPFSPESKFSAFGTDLGVLQVKNVDDANSVVQHFIKNPDIPAAIPERLLNSPSLALYRHKILSLESLGVDPNAVRESVRIDLEHLVENHIPLAHGSATEAISAKADSSARQPSKG
ncbi:MAG: hypothetical protein EOP04_26750, partial [Proteobacteria bacterium]